MGAGLLVAGVVFTGQDRSGWPFLMAGVALVVLAGLWDRIGVLSATRNGFEVRTVRQEAAEAAEQPLAELVEDVSSRAESAAASGDEKEAAVLRDVQQLVRFGAERAVTAAAGGPSSSSGSYQVRQRPGDGFVRLECAVGAYSAASLSPLGLLCRVTDPHGTVFETPVSPVSARGISGLERVATVDFPHDFDHVPAGLAPGTYKVDWLQRALFTGGYSVLGVGRFTWE